MKTFENICPLALAATFDRSMLEMALSTPVMRECFTMECELGEDPYLTSTLRKTAERRLETPVRPLDGDTVNGILGHISTGSMVLLKNSKRLLPLTSQLLKTLAVIGPAVDGSITDGFKNAAPQHIQLAFAKGCPPDDTFSDELLAGALSTAVRADAVILCLNAYESPRLPAPQLALLEALNMLGKPVAVVVFDYSSRVLESVYSKSDAVLLAWRATPRHGSALGYVLFGHVNPSGRLPLTIPRADDERTEAASYLYTRQEPLYPFGYGLSYTRFLYSGLKISAPMAERGEIVTARCTVENVGALPGHEVSQLYLRHDHRDEQGRPRWSLCGIERIFLHPNETSTVEFTLPPLTEAGRYVVYAGGHQPDARSVWLSETPVLSAFVEVD